MRASLRYGLLLAISLAAGCGGGTADPGTAPPPPPPPPSGIPASVSIAAGDNQQAASGTAVSVPPSVVVRNAQNQPVAGVTVQFSVAEGGGTVTGASPITDAQGSAAAGSWTLGAIGPQRLSAQVGSLSPVSFQAGITPGTEEVSAAVTPAGGTVEISLSGHPYNGLKLTVPPGTFATPNQFRMRVVQNPSLPSLPAGYRMAGPALEVHSELIRGSELMTLDVPVTHAANEDVVIAFHDPVRRITEVMPTISVTAGSIRVATAHLRADQLIGKPRPAMPSLRVSTALQSSFPTGNTGWLFPVAVTLPLAPVPPVLDPATQRWPVIDHGSAVNPTGQGAGITALVALASSDATAQLAQKVNALTTPGFYGEAAPLVAVIEAQTKLYELLIQTMQALHQLQMGAIRGGTAELAHHNIVAGMGISGSTSVAALLPATPGADPVFVNTVSGDELNIAMLAPASAGLVQLTRNPSTGFQAVGLPTAADLPAQLRDELVPLSSFLVDYQVARANYDQLKSILAMAPNSQQRTDANAAMAAQVGLNQTPIEQSGVNLNVWIPWDNGTIKVRAFETQLRQGSAGNLPSPGFILSWPQTGEEKARLVNQTPILVASLLDLNDAPDGVSVSYIAAPYQVISGMDRQSGVFPVTMIKAPFKVTPELVTISAAQRRVDLQALVPDPPSAGYRIRWDWGDGTAPVENVGVNTASHTYAVAGDFTASATLLTNDAAKQEIAKVTATVDSPAEPVWLITSISDQDGLFDAEAVEGEGELHDLFLHLVTVPGSGLITVSDLGFATNLNLVVLKSEVWQPSDCCPLPNFHTRAWITSLGIDPPFTDPVGPFFAGWESSFWQQSTPDLDSGTMTAQNVLSTTVHKVKNGGSQVGPTGGLRLSATRNGTEMTGVISVAIVWTDDDSGEVEEPIELFRLPFTAKRAK